MTGTAVTFAVAGIPVPQGSAKAIVHRSTGRAVLIPSRGDALAAWRADIRHAAACALDSPATGPVDVELDFAFTRPKSHRRANRTLAPKAPPAHIQRPDVDKLSRAVLDALTGIAYLDDAQVAFLAAGKRWLDSPLATSGVTVTINARHPHPTNVVEELAR